MMKTKKDLQRKPNRYRKIINWDVESQRYIRR